MPLLSDLVRSAGPGELDGGVLSNLFGSLGSVGLAGSGDDWWAAPLLLLSTVPMYL